MDIILCSDHLIFVSLAIYRTSQNLLSLYFFICKYLSVARNGNDTEASLVLPLHSQPRSNTHREGGLLHVGKEEAREQMLGPDCRVLPTLLCPENIQDFVVQGFLELIQGDSLHDK